MSQDREPPVADPPPWIAAPPAPAARSSRLGWVALIAGVLTMLGPILFWGALALLPGEPFAGTSSGYGDDRLPGLIAIPLGLWACLALWAIVQGIVAIAQRRGVRPGVVAIVLGVAAPVIWPVALTIWLAVMLVQLP